MVKTTDNPALALALQASNSQASIVMTMGALLISKYQKPAPSRKLLASAVNPADVIFEAVNSKGSSIAALGSQTTIAAIFEELLRQDGVLNNVPSGVNITEVLWLAAKVRPVLKDDMLHNCVISSANDIFFAVAGSKLLLICPCFLICSTSDISLVAWKHV